MEFGLGFWCSSGIAVGSALLATLFSDMKRSVLSLWVCGLGVGGLFLGAGMEFLAVIQWLVSSWVCIGLLLYLSDYKIQLDPRRRGLLIAAAVAASLLTVAIGLGLENLPHLLPGEELAASGLSELGNKIFSDHLLTFEILGVLVLVSILGSGVLMRSVKR